MHQETSLSHVDALKIIEAIRLELEKDNKGAAVAVVDAHGELIAFLKTDFCRPSVINIAIHKAFTAAREQVESEKVGQAAVEYQFPITNFGDLRYTGWGGGIPITCQGKVIGAVGVSGLLDQDDIDLAKMGAALINQ
jgi:glc operon protein GlcG